MAYSVLSGKSRYLCRWTNLAAASLLAVALAGCSGGGGGGDPAPVGGGAVTPPAATSIATAAALPANDSATNPTSAFQLVQDSGVPAVTVNSAPVVNFTVISDGAVLKGLETTPGDARFIIAQLVPGANGDPDQWKAYTYRTETATAGVGPGGTPVLASAVQANTVTATAATLKFNEAGYYTFTFTDDIKDITKTNGVVFDPALTHRVAIQLRYTNKAGETVLVNPYFDFTIDASGKSVAVTDVSKTRKMVDVSNCNECHNKLALHGGGRVDTQFCVLCHNASTTDANSGNVLELKTMIHKIHAGRRLAAKGVNYSIWGFSNSQHDYAEVGFPQDLRNCFKCHTASKLDAAGNPVSPQGDNWKKKPSKQACLTCHTSDAASTWFGLHVTQFSLGADAASISNSSCESCHGEGRTWSPEQAHFNQVEANEAKYKMNIESATYDATTRRVTVKYFVSDPTNGNTAYNLTADCTGVAPAALCSNSNKFGRVTIYLAYQNLIGQPTAVTEFSAGNGVSAKAFAGTNDGTNHYTVDLVVPADSATAAAAGTARVLTVGRIVEPKLDAISRLPVTPAATVNTSMRGVFTDVVLSGTLNPRRTVVATEKCNACHSDLGAASGSNTLPNAFHSGDRDYVESCVLCHDQNRTASIMTDGSGLLESYQFKRMIHGIHGNSKRQFPFTQGNTAVGPHTKEGCTAALPAVQTCSAGTTNFFAEVRFPGILQNCNNCHVNDSWKSDKSVLGAVIVKTDPVTLLPITDPLQRLVISPKAATCTACHDDIARQAHVVLVGGGAFGKSYDFLTNTQPPVTQGDIIAGRILETCDGCHAPGTLKPVDVAHGLLK